MPTRTLPKRNAVVQRRYPIQSHVDVYVVSLFTANIFQGVVATMSLKWARTGRVECGTHCTIQGSYFVSRLSSPVLDKLHLEGFLYQFGQTGVAMNTLAIAVHTFCVVFFRWRPPPSKLIPLCVVACIWLYNTLFASIGYGTHTGKGDTQPFYIPTPFCAPFNRCSLYHSIPTRFASQYIWINLAIFTSIALYVPLFFSIRGNIEVLPTGDRWYDYSFKLVRSPDRGGVSVTAASPCGSIQDPLASAWISSAAKKMLWYPVAYIITALPANLLRWGILHKLDPDVPVKEIRFTTIAVACFLVNASGIINVTLFAFTRPNILLFGERRDHMEHSSSSMRRERRGLGDPALSIEMGSDVEVVV
ncbi:hypothetical protein BOTBODRAFT_185972 [Botryobasidium botryosum FD-172 SS1]|uniref:Glucose receptor Git3 N-terminal domain-containing protein n=1 Tax=Botryobasidium botryosum (strain FD-172 SS1) TaxID=930990 RepID=A0A067MZF5_BOTB1|nr:hypothetical protein BOTBODRAFT_185972 [Botryobasidium botryosum FD-172 SS1]